MIHGSSRGDELDAALPDNPVYLQVTRDSSFVNSRAIEAVGIDEMTDPAFERDADGRLTGVITNDDAADDVKTAAGFSPQPAGGVARDLRVCRC